MAGKFWASSCNALCTTRSCLVCSTATHYPEYAGGFAGRCDRGFIHDHQFWQMQQRDANIHPTFSCPGIFEIRDAGGSRKRSIQHFIHTLLQLLSRKPYNFPQTPDSLCREVFVTGNFLRTTPQRFGFQGFFFDGMPKDQRIPCVRRKKAGQHIDGGRLAAPLGPSKLKISPLWMEKSTHSPPLHLIKFL